MVACFWGGDSEIFAMSARQMHVLTCEAKMRCVAASYHHADIGDQHASEQHAFSDAIHVLCIPVILLLHKCFSHRW